MILTYMGTEQGRLSWMSFALTSILLFLHNLGKSNLKSRLEFMGLDKTDSNKSVYPGKSAPKIELQKLDNPKLAFKKHESKGCVSGDK